VNFAAISACECLQESVDLGYLSYQRADFAIGWSRIVVGRFGAAYSSTIDGDLARVRPLWVGDKVVPLVGSHTGDARA